MKNTAPLTFALTLLLTYLRCHAAQDKVTVTVKSRNQETSGEKSDLSSLENKATFDTVTQNTENSSINAVFKRRRLDALGRPSCVSWGNWQVHCLYRGVNNSVYHLNITNGNRSKPVSIGGKAFNNIQCVSTAIGKISCILLDGFNSVWIRSYKDGSWANWIKQTQKFNEIGRGSCTRRTDTLFTCLLRHSQDYAMQMDVVEGKSVASFVSLGKKITYRSFFACLSRIPNTMHCIGVNHMNLLMDLQWNKTRLWNHGIGLNVQVGYHPEPSVVLISNSRFYVFGVNRAHEVVATRWDLGPQYSKPVTVGNLKVEYSPECVQVKNELLYCFAVGVDRFLYIAYFTGSEWSSWEKKEYRPVESPSCVLADSDTIYCLVNLGNTYYSVQFTVSVNSSPAK